MDVVVVLEFCQREEVCPVVLSLIDEYPKVLLQFLIDPLRLSVTLWVIGHGGRYLNPKYTVQLPSEFCYELRTLVRDYLAGYAMEFPNMLNSLAVPAADRVVNVGMKWARLVKESTTTNMALWPDDSGSSTMKSTLTVSQGASGTGRG